jgi:hypothetical protein
MDHQIGPHFIALIFPVNIHSHLIGAVLFLFFVATFNSTYITTHAATTWIDTAVFMIFLVGAVFCFICSATFHTVTCHSQEVSHIPSLINLVLFTRFTGFELLSLFRLCWHSHSYRWIFFSVYILRLFLRAEIASCISYCDDFSRPRLVCYNGYEAMNTAQYRMHRCCIHCLES